MIDSMTDLLQPIHIHYSSLSLVSQLLPSHDAWYRDQLKEVLGAHVIGGPTVNIVFLTSSFFFFPP